MARHLDLIYFGWCFLVFDKKNALVRPYTVNETLYNKHLVLHELNFLLDPVELDTLHLQYRVLE